MDKKQVESDTISNLIGGLSSLVYFIDVFEEFNPLGLNKFQVKKWCGELNKVYAKGIDTTYNGICDKYPDFGDLLDITNQSLIYHIINKKIPSVEIINKIFKTLDSDKSKNQPILNQAYNEAMASNSIEFSLRGYDLVVGIYTQLLFIKQHIKSCMMRDILYKTKKFINFINKGIEIFGKLIKTEDKKYINSCTNVLSALDLHNLMLVSEVTIVHNYKPNILITQEI